MLAGLEIEEGEDERGVSWCGVAVSSDSPRSLSKSPMHRSGPPIPLMFGEFWSPRHDSPRFFLPNKLVCGIWAP